MASTCATSTNQFRRITRLPAYARFTLNEPGKYYLQLVNHYNKAQVWAATEFTVSEDTVGPRAVGNTAARQRKAWICKTVDDNWNCVEGANEWKAKPRSGASF